MIERIFGVLKQRFRILLLMPHYNIPLQARIPAALCALQNFIRIHDADEGPLPSDGLPAKNSRYTTFSNDNTAGIGTGIDEAENIDEASARRDNIANTMWISYQDYIQRNQSPPTDDDIDNYLDFDDAA